jgi:hypothetical protein
MIETLAQELKARKVLYAHIYYSRDDFWQIYDKAGYDTLRSKYGATTVFPDIYEKVHVAERYHSAIKKGLGKLAYRKLKGLMSFRPS